MVNFGYPYNDIVICKDSTDYLRFYHILHKNSIGHLLRTSQDYFRPPPPRFREQMDSIYVHFRRVFVGFVVLLTKIWPTNIDF